MLMRTWLLSPVVMLTLAPLALAEDKKDEESMEEGRIAAIGEPAPPLRVREGESGDKSKPQDIIERNRRNVVVLLFFRTNDPVSQELLPGMIKLHGDLSSKGLKVILISDERSERVSEFLKSKGFSGEFISNAYLPYPYNVPAVPRAYVIDPDGILVTHFHPADRFEQRIREQLAKTPPPGADPAAMEKRLGQAGEALQAKQYGRAYMIARDIEALAAKGSPLADNAKKLREQIESAARERLAEARKLAEDKQWDEVTKIVAEISVRLSGSKVAEEADTEISRLSAERDVKAKIRTAIDTARGEVMMDQAAEHEAAARYVESIRVLRDIINRYPDSAIAKKAADEVDRINNDPRAQTEIVARRNEEEAERWYDIAERFAKVGMYGKAREYFELIREKHPRSRVAAEVPKRLKDLPEPEADEEPEESTEDEAAEKPSKD
jgi:phosphoglycolate phosphatase-like HAD superfamily hydrolase